MLKTILFAAATGITAAFAAAVPAESTTTENVNGYMVLSTLPGFSGNVQTLPWESNTCYPVPTSMDNVVQAADPHPYNANANCYLWRGTACHGERSPVLIAPGYDNFAAHGIYGPWKSWWCTCGGACQSNGTNDKRDAPDNTPSKRADNSSTAFVQTRQTNDGPSLRQRASQVQTHLKLFSDPDFQGDCSKIAANFNTCVNIPAPLSQDIQSAAPDCGAGCMLYANLGCRGYSSGVSEIWYPGLQDLNILDKGTVWNSFECTADASASCSAVSERADAAPVEAVEVPRSTAPETKDTPDTHLTLCSEPNYQGECYQLDAYWGGCTSIPADVGNNIQSAYSEAPELVERADYAVNCSLSFNEWCQGYYSRAISNPGVADTHIWDKGTSWASFSCAPVVPQPLSV